MKASIATLTLVVLIVLAVYLNIPQTPATKPVINQVPILSNEIITSPFYDQWYFHKAIIYAKSSKTRFDTRPKIIILPHHLTGAHIIADLLSAASGYKYSQVNLIGPNHRESGREKFITSDTPANKTIIESDHSIGNPTLFIRYYFPDTTLRPYVIKHDASIMDITSWADDLVQNSPTDSLYIFSLDFSHFIPANISVLRDQTTLDLIKNSDIQKILTLSNEYVDSPSGLALSIVLSKDLSLSGPHQIHHTNSGYLNNDFSTGVTSYFGLVFLNPSIN